MNMNHEINAVKFSLNGDSVIHHLFTQRAFEMTAERSNFPQRFQSLTYAASDNQKNIGVNYLSLLCMLRIPHEGVSQDATNSILIACHAIACHGS